MTVNDDYRTKGDNYDNNIDIDIYFDYNKNNYGNEINGSYNDDIFSH